MPNITVSRTEEDIKPPGGILVPEHVPGAECDELLDVLYARAKRQPSLSSTIAARKLCSRFPLVPDSTMLK